MIAVKGLMLKKRGNPVKHNASVVSFAFEYRPHAVIPQTQHVPREDRLRMIKATLWSPLLELLIGNAQLDIVLQTDFAPDATKPDNKCNQELINLWVYILLSLFRFIHLN